MITVGSQFTTAKNDNGTTRIRLDVNGNVRWTTVKGV